MECQEKSLSEAKICRKLPQELPRAVQEQQEHGGLGRTRDRVVSPPPRQGPNSCHPGGTGMGVSPPLEGRPGTAAPAGVGRGVQLPPTPAAPGSGSQAGSGHGDPPGAAPERPGGSSGPGPRALGGQGGEGGPLSSPLHPFPSPILVPPPCRTTEQRFPASSDTTSTAFLRQVLGGQRRGFRHPKMHSHPFEWLMHPPQCPHHLTVSPGGLGGAFHHGI